MSGEALLVRFDHSGGALAGVIIIASRDLGGAAKMWTQIAAIASSLGITAKAVANCVVSLGREAESPIYALEKIDVKAWAITMLPENVGLDNPKIRSLRRSA